MKNFQWRWVSNFQFIFLVFYAGGSQGCWARPRGFLGGGGVAGAEFLQGRAQSRETWTILGLGAVHQNYPFGRAFGGAPGAAGSGHGGLCGGGAGGSSPGASLRRKNLRLVPFLMLYGGTSPGGGGLSPGLSSYSASCGHALMRPGHARLHRHGAVQHVGLSFMRPCAHACRSCTPTSTWSGTAG